MIRNYELEYKVIQRNAIDIVATADEPEKFSLYLTFSPSGKSVYKKENKMFLDDTELGFELDMHSESEYESLKTAYRIIEKSIENGIIY